MAIVSIATGIAGGPSDTWYPNVCRLHVEPFIKHAIHKGWSFQSRGRDFLLEATNEVFEWMAGPQKPASRSLTRTEANNAVNERLFTAR